MWTQQKPSGNICYFERYKDPITGKTRTVTATLKPTGRKRNDARAARAALDQKIADAMANSGKPDAVTFKVLCENYCAWQRQNHKAQTAEASKRRTASLRRMIGDDAIVANLTAPYVAKCLHSDDPTTYNERLTRFKALIRWGYQADLIENISWIDKIRRREDKTAREKDYLKYLERDEIAKLIGGMSIDIWRLLTEFLVLTGLRIGEAIALEDSDIDLSAGAIRITKTFSLPIHNVSTTKTATSTRTISIQPELEAVCRKISADTKRRSLMYGFRTHHFFCDDDGRRISYDAYRIYIERRTEKLIGRKLSPHSLRHTHVALLAEAGVPLETISRRLGHSDGHTTRDVYFHVTKRMEEHDRQLLDGVQILQTS